MLTDLLRDPEYREALAEQSYNLERLEDAALDREHEMDPDVDYYAMAWSSLEEWAKRPYRTAVAVALDSIASHVPADA